MATARKKKRAASPRKRERSTAAVPKGHLLAVDGTTASELERGVKRLADLLGDEPDSAPCSRWDASNTFFELRLRKDRGAPVPVRTLLLLYAADLLFRLRWEIQPALDKGLTVIAAPYVETAIAFGVAAGLPQDWLVEVFSFAPQPRVSFHVKEKKKGRTKRKRSAEGVHLKSAKGFVEFCSRLLATGDPVGNATEIRAATLQRLQDREAEGAIVRLGKKLPKVVARQLKGKLTKSSGR